MCQVGNKCNGVLPQQCFLKVTRLLFVHLVVPFRGVSIMVCAGSVPTVDLSLLVPAAIAEGAWGWAAHPRFPGVLASEYVYTAREAVAVVRAFARALAPQLNCKEVARFAVLARGRVTGMILARDEWAWVNGAYAPTGEPWETFRAAARRYYELTGQLIEQKHYQTCVHLRHREDVPHEHALPDLYGLPGIPAPREHAPRVA